MLYIFHFWYLGYFLKGSWTSYVCGRSLVSIGEVERMGAFRKERCFFFEFLNFIRHKLIKHSNPLLLFFLSSTFWQNFRVAMYDTKGELAVGHITIFHNLFLSLHWGRTWSRRSYNRYMDSAGKKKKADFSSSQSISLLVQQHFNQSITFCLPVT